MTGLDIIYDAILDGTVTYEQAADMFVQTAVGQSTGVARDDILAKLRAQFPTREALAAQLLEYVSLLPLVPTPRGPLQ
jgi:hypothetical protein